MLPSEQTTKILVVAQCKSSLGTANHHSRMRLCWSSTIVLVAEDELVVVVIVVVVSMLSSDCGYWVSVGMAASL